MNILTLNALAAARANNYSGSMRILCPRRNEPGCLETINKIKEKINPKSEIKGVLRTMFDVKKQPVWGGVRHNSKGILWQQTFLDVVFQGMFAWQRRQALECRPSLMIADCLGAKAYLALAKEIIKKTME